MLSCLNKLFKNGFSIIGTNSILARVNKVLKYGVSYADTTEVLPAVGKPADFFDSSYLSKHGWCKEKEHDWWRDELNWENLVDRDRAPIPSSENREGYFEDHHLGFWISGYSDYRKTLSAVEPYGIRGGRYYDFGGSTGRVFRHFAFQSDKWDVWSSDFKISSVEWNQINFPKSVKTFLNNCNPSLPLPDNYFDLISAYSVFTHINEAESTWLLELRRILKVGGIAYISIHDEATWQNKAPMLKDTVDKFRPYIADCLEMPEGKTVITFRDDDPYNCNVFHSRQYIERVWGRYFEICEVKSQNHDQQAVVICRRPD